jgi:hypothetical protein
MLYQGDLLRIKIDKQDSELIARFTGPQTLDYGSLNQKIRELKALVRRLDALIDMW